MLYADIDAHIEALEVDQPAADDSAWTPSSMEPSNPEISDAMGSIFDDVDA